MPFETEFYLASGQLTEHWYAVLQSKELRKTPTKVVVFDVPFVIWRNSEGRARAAVDRCPHRNAPLSKGKNINGCIACPYHGWTFDGEGKCVEIPSQVDEKHLKGHKLQTVACVEKYGLIWIWTGRGEASGAPFEMPTMEGEKGWRHYYMYTEFENGVTNLVENFMDVPHTVFVHQGWFRDRKKIPIDALVEKTVSSVLVSYNQSADSIGFNSRLINPKGLPMRHSDNFYMPNNTLVDYIFGEYDRGFIISSTCTPVSKYFSRVFTLITYKFGWMNPLASLWLPWYTRKVIQQDVDIMNLQGENLKRFATNSFESTPSDQMHVAIEELRKAAALNQEKETKTFKSEIRFWV